MLQASPGYCLSSPIVCTGWGCLQRLQSVRKVVRRLLPPGLCWEHGSSVLSCAAGVECTLMRGRALDVWMFNGLKPCSVWRSWGLLPGKRGSTAFCTASSTTRGKRLSSTFPCSASAGHEFTSMRYTCMHSSGLQLDAVGDSFSLFLLTWAHNCYGSVSLPNQRGRCSLIRETNVFGIGTLSNIHK